MAKLSVKATFRRVLKLGRECSVGAMVIEGERVCEERPLMWPLTPLSLGRKPAGGEGRLDGMDGS